jgi:hypothetical protein
MFIFIKQANDLSEHYPPPPPGRRTTADIVVELMQVVLAPERLFSLPSRTITPVFVHEFFFFTGHISFMCIHLLIKMMSEQHTSS